MSKKPETMHICCDVVFDEYSLINPDSRLPIPKQSKLFAHVALWQIEDGQYGFRMIRAVKNNPVLLRFLDEYADFLKQEIQGMTPTPETIADFHTRLDKAWVKEGVAAQRFVGRIKYRLKWIGGLTIARYLMHGYSEAWMWLFAATRMRTRGQVATMVWSWARAASGVKSSREYSNRIKALYYYLSH